MARTARAAPGGVCYHVINRGNRRDTVYHSPADYDYFMALMHKASARISMRTLAYCLMPNHFHLVLWPYQDGDLSRWMHWLMTSHVVRYNKLYRKTGRVWQGRFKAFPIEQDRHLLNVLRYVERNPVRANLVDTVVDWKWSSIGVDTRSSGLISESPVTKPEEWIQVVDRPLSDEELNALRCCSHKCRPYGSEAWVLDTAGRLGLESSLREAGRPKKGHS